jgi:pimeloyl-ACP methyl ester carboxylesterase
MTEYAESPTKMVSAANGIDYAFREVGAGDVPLVLLQHFRGNLDNWDPALIDALAPTAPVVTFDNAGVGVDRYDAGDIADGARDRVRRRDGPRPVDLLGPRSFVAQEIASPTVGRAQARARIGGADGRGGHARLAPDVIEAVGGPQPNPEDICAPSRRPTRARLRGSKRSSASRGTSDRDTPRRRATAVRRACAWASPIAARAMPRIEHRCPSPARRDPMILPHYSHLLAGLIPDARIKIYPDSAHGFLFQHHAEFAADVAGFLHDR